MENKKNKNIVGKRKMLEKESGKGIGKSKK